MKQVHPPVGSQNGDILQVGTWDGVEFPVPLNEEESCFWSLSCVLCCTELLGCEEKKLYLYERDWRPAQISVLEKMRSRARGIRRKMAKFIS